MVGGLPAVTHEGIDAVEMHIHADIDALGAAAAQRIIAVISRDPAAVIGLATGSSPRSLYTAWGRQARALGLDQRQVRGFALDEYVGLDPEHPQSYHSVIRHEAVAATGLDPAHVRVPEGHGDVAAAAYDFERGIREAGGIDVQILGIGRNGHLAFNEPGSSADSRTREVQLTDETIADNARFFASVDEVPRAAITQGLGTILEARELVVVAIGEAKAAAVAAALEGPITEQVPASLLREHGHVRWFVDEAAASALGSR